MDDRDRDLTQLFVRDLDAIPLPPRGAWRRAPKKEHIAMRASRSFLTAGAAIAVLVLALIVGLQLRDRSETAASPSASPRPSPSASASAGAVAPTASPSATPTPSSAAVLDDRFGFIVSAVGAGASIRSETGSDVSNINGTLLVPSPTGDRIAYVASAPSAPMIHVRTLADGADRTIVSGLAPTDRVNRLAWSSDGTGLLVATGSGSDTGPGTEATLQTADLSGGLPTLVAKRNDGRVYAPIAWDRAANLVAAAETGAGGFASAYLTFDLSQTPPRAKSVPIPGRVGIPQASTDAKYALAADFDSNQVRYWPLADYGAGKTAGQTTGGAQWQPGSHRIGIVNGDAFQLFQVDDGTTATVFRGLKTGTATQPGAAFWTFRVDGSAVVTGVPVGTGLGSTEYAMTRLADGASVTFQATGGLGRSVRLRN